MKRSAISMLVVGSLATWNGAYAQTCFSDAFTYGAGPGELSVLGASGGWTDNAVQTGRILIVNDQVQLVFPSDGTDNGDHTDTNTNPDCLPCAADNTVTFTAILQVPALGQTGGNIGNIHVISDTGQSLARWRITPSQANPAVGAGGNAAAWTIDTTPKEIKAVMNFNTRDTHFYFDGDLVGVLVDWPNNTAFNTAASVQSISIQNLDRADGTFDGSMTIDDMEIKRCPGSCSSDVDPPIGRLTGGYESDEGTSHTAVGGTVFDTPKTLTLTNSSAAISVDVTATEVNATGGAATYPIYDWLSLSPTSVLGVGPAGTAVFSAALSVGTLPAGLYASIVRIADNCAPQFIHDRTMQLAVGSAPCYAEAFYYSNGALTGRGGWAGVAPGNVIAVDPNDASNQALQVDLAQAPDTTVTIPGCTPCEDGTVTAIVKAKWSGITTGGNALHVSYDGGKNFAMWRARWNGSAMVVHGYTAGSAQFTGAPTGTMTNANQWYELKAVINTVTNKTAYYFEGALLDTQSHGSEYGQTAGDFNAITSITVDPKANADGSFYLDDMQIQSCPGECGGHVDPERQTAVGPNITKHAWAAEVGGTPDTAGFDYTYNNDNPGLTTLSYTLDEVTSAGASTNTLWFSLIDPLNQPKTGGGPLAPHDVDEDVTALLDTTQASVGTQTGYFTFTDTCGPQRVHTRALKLSIGDCYADTFDYVPNGISLESAPGWKAYAEDGSNAIEVTGGHVVIHGGTPTTGDDTVSAETQQAMTNGCPVCPDVEGPTGQGLFVVTIEVTGHNTQAGSSAFWEMRLLGTNHNPNDPYAYWQGGSTYVDPAGDQSNRQYFTDGPDELKIIVNPNVHTVQGIPMDSARYFFNDTEIKTEAYGGGNRLRYIHLVRYGNDVSGDTYQDIQLDNLSVSPCVEICHEPAFDVRDAGNTDPPVSDNHVDDSDLQNAFLPCIEALNGPSVYPGLSGHGYATVTGNFDALSKECKCMDRNGDHALDLEDFAFFQRCYTGSTQTVTDTDCDD